MNEDGLTPLFLACQVGNFAAALKLLHASVETDLPEESQNHDLLLHAVRTGDRLKEDGYIARLGPIHAREKSKLLLLKHCL